MPANGRCRSSIARSWTGSHATSCRPTPAAGRSNFENGKQLLGFEDPANRLPKAVQRTAPMAMVLVSLITLWFHQAGYRHVQFPHRPWYTRKREPSFADMLGTLRRLSWTEFWQQADPPNQAKKSVSPFLAKMIEFLSRAG